MFILNIFNWLVKKVPYAFAVALPSTLWAASVAASLYIMVVFSQAEFENTNTGNIFVLSILFGVSVVLFVVTPIREGFFRVVGFKRGEMTAARILNDNIINGKIIKNISDDSLLKVFHALRDINIQILKLAEWCIITPIFFSALVEYFVSHNIINVLVISVSAFVAFLVVMIFSVALYELATAPARKEAKSMLVSRGIKFKETPLFSIRMKFGLFPALTGIILIVALLSVKPLNATLVVLSLFGFLIVYILNRMVFYSIYQDFSEVKESVENIGKNKEVISCFGSLDEEIIDLSKSIDGAAEEIYTNRRKLEDNKQTLQKANEEINKGKLELDKFYKLTVGRELMMIELKKKIEILEKKHS